MQFIASTEFNQHVFKLKQEEAARKEEIEWFIDFAESTMHQFHYNRLGIMSLLTKNRDCPQGVTKVD